MMWFGAFFVTIVAVAYAQNRAIAHLTGDKGITGLITFTSTPQGLLVTGNITGLTPGNHGFHIHEHGDLSEGCASTGAHFNPSHRPHGAPQDAERHAGDLGNVVADGGGVARVHIVDSHIALSGAQNILGRALVVHSGEDDLGRGGHNDSRVTGHAGGRLACGVVENGARGAGGSQLGFGLVLLLLSGIFYNV